MRIEKYIVEKFARRIEKVIVFHTKRCLVQMKGDALLSGDDSPLCNVWDEICVQQRGGESFYWPIYEEIIDQILLEKVNRLDRTSVLALWAQTDDGSDWLYDHYADKDGFEQASVDYYMVVIYLRRLLLQKATDEYNERVSKYFYPVDNELDSPSG